MPAKTSKKYWRDRAIEREAHWQDKSRATIEKELAIYYGQSLAQIEKDIAALYMTYATDNNLSYRDAIRLLHGDEYRVWRMGMREYIDAIGNDKDNPLLRELNTLAMRSRISRLDRLHAETLMELDKLGRKTESAMRDFLGKAYKDNYYRGLYEIGKAGQMLSSVTKVDPGKLEAVLRVPWSGKNYSQRIWQNADRLGKTIQDVIVNGLHRGDSPQKMVRFVRERMGVGRSDAERLVRTELNYVQNQSALDSIKDAGLEYYQFVATLDRRTTPMCREHDGKTYPVEAASPGENMPPLHSRCRSTIFASFGEGTGTRQEKRIARDKEDKNIHVPADMTYKDWKAVYIDKTKTFAEWEKSSASDVRNGLISAGKVNAAKAIDSFHLIDDVEKHVYTPADLMRELQKSPIGRETIQHIEESDAIINLVDEKQPHSDRGRQAGREINIFSANIRDLRVAGQTVIHEMVHYWYDIGGCQHAEAICFAMEKMHLVNRAYLTKAEWKQMVKLAVDNYPHLEWEAGGYGDFSKFDFVR